MAAVIASLATQTAAYEVPTHRRLSEMALTKSNVASRLSDLGLRSLESKLTMDLIIPTTNDTAIVCSEPAILGQVEQVSIMELVQRGSYCEDATFNTTSGGRYTNHGYDPAHGGEGFSTGVPGVNYRSSLDWGLESAPIPGQTYSYADAKGYLFAGITDPEHFVRENSLALMFFSLGHVLHLIQDLAQPQHTRNDPHGLGSFYERYTKDLILKPAWAAYPSFVAKLPQDVWHGTTAPTGLADYSNLGFVTTGTNFEGSGSDIRASSRYAQPDGSGVDIDKVQITSLPNAVNPTNPLQGEIWFIKKFVPDANTGAGAVNPRMSTYSIFDENLALIGNGELQFTLNRFNFDAAHDMLLPRAIGYSAGLLNYFFRGQMEVSLPDSGVYSILDTSSACTAPCGFKHIRMKIRNVTPTEQMGAGRLWLVAKYHRNVCYRADGSGDYGGSNFTDGGPNVPRNPCRSTFPQVSVSDAVVVEGVASSFAEHPFVFPNVIPIDASDLTFQVVFRGQLGGEADNVSVSAKNVAEPNHFAIANVTDYVFDDLGDRKYHALPFAGISTSQTLYDFGIAFGQNTIPLAKVPLLPPGKFARVSYLMDRFVDVDVPMTIWYYASAHADFVRPENFELEESTQLYRRSCPVWKKRGIHWDSMMFQAQYRSTSGHGPLGATPRPGARSARALEAPRSRSQNMARSTYLCGVPNEAEFYLDDMSAFTIESSVPWVIEGDDGAGARKSALQ